MANSLQVLQDIEKEILLLLESYHRYAESGYMHPADMLRIDKMKRQIRQDINAQIKQYNLMREQAKLRYYYLIVTREALGLRKHQWVEAYYRIPPKRECLEE